MPTRAELDPLFFQKVKEQLVPELLESGIKAIKVYELGITPEGDLDYSNYLVGCAFWEGSFRRVKRLCLNPKSFFNCVAYSNILEISANFNGQYVKFFMARVDKNSRQPKSAKGIKKLLHATIIQSQCFLSDEIKNNAMSHGVYTIGVDLDEDNGIGKITFDLLVPSGTKACQALTMETLYDSESQPLVAPIPEIPRKPTVHRDVTPHLAKTEPYDTKSTPEQIEKKQAIRQDVQQRTKNANNIS